MGNEEIDNLKNLLNEKNNQLNQLNQELSNEKKINNKTKDYLLLLESKVVEFDKQKEITIQNNEINTLKQELKSSKLTESYIMKILDLRNELNEI